MNGINELIGSLITIIICTVFVIVLAIIQIELPSAALIQGISAIEIIIAGISIFDLLNILIFCIKLLNL